MRPTANGEREAPAWPAPAFARDAPTVLLTVGTSIEERDGDVLPGLLAAALRSAANVIVTSSADVPAGVDAERVRAVGFTPLAGLLPHVDAVLGVGGTGTVLATLRAGIPSVILPIKADQPFNAERAAGLGVALVISQPGQATAALDRVLTEATFADTARSVARQLSDLPDAAAVLHQLLGRLAPARESR